MYYYGTSKTPEYSTAKWLNCEMNAKVENVPVCVTCNFKFFHCSVKYTMQILLIDENTRQLKNSYRDFFLAKNKGKIWCHQTHQDWCLLWSTNLHESRYLLWVIKTIRGKRLTFCYHYININLKSRNPDKHYFAMFFRRSM